PRYRAEGYGLETRLYLMTHAISLPFVAECTMDPSRPAHIFYRFRSACSMVSSLIHPGTNVSRGFGDHRKDRTSEGCLVERGLSLQALPRLPQLGHSAV